MRIGLTVSVLFHLALLGWAIGSLKATEEFVVPPAPVIEAELVTVAEFTNLRKGDPDSKKMDAKLDETEPEDPAKQKAPQAKPKSARELAAEPPPPAEPPKPDPPAKEEPPPAPPPEPPKAEAPPPVEPDPIAEKLAALPPTPVPPRPSEEERRKAAEELEKKREEERKKQEAERKKKEAEQKKKLAEEKKRREAEEKKRKLAEEKRRREEAKKSFDADRIAALLDKTPEKRGGSTANTNAPSQPTEQRGPTAGERAGTGDRLTAREQDLILSRVQQALRGCWRLPGAGGGVQIPVVVLRWTMLPDGSVDGSPVVVSNEGGTLSRQAEEAARRALYCVQRFDLPPEHYNSWRRMEFAFDFQEY